MTRLSVNAKAALEVLQEKNLAYTIAKTTIEQELKRELQTRLSVIRHERDMAVRVAADAGVPKTQLGKAIGTSNYKTIQDILADVSTVLSSTTTIKNVVVEPHGENTFRIVVNNFGDQNVSGSVIVSVDGGVLSPESGDMFVLPQIYRNNAYEYVQDLINAL